MRQFIDVTIDEKEYRLQKFTPPVACFWHGRLMGDILANAEASMPNGLSSVPKGQGEIVKMLMKIAGKMLHADQETAFLFQKNCLEPVSAKFQAGFFPVVDAAGNYQEGIPAPTFQNLIIRSFVYSMSDFFDPAVAKGLLVAIKESLPSTLLEQLKTLVSDSSGTQSSGDTGDSTNSGTEPTASPIS